MGQELTQSVRCHWDDMEWCTHFVSSLDLYLYTACVTCSTGAQKSPRPERRLHIQRDSGQRGASGQQASIQYSVEGNGSQSARGNWTLSSRSHIADLG